MLLDRTPGFGIYIHWPFCAAKCPYCDFNSHVRHQTVDQERFAAALSTERPGAAVAMPSEEEVRGRFGPSTA